jgi:hypothetical protein
MNKKPVMRAIRLEEALADLMDAENILSKLEAARFFRHSVTGKNVDTTECSGNCVAYLPTCQKTPA